MQREKWTYRRVLQLLIVVAAYAYLLYRLCTFDDYATFFAYFREAGWMQWVCLGIAVLLFPLNILFESLKWRTLLQNIAPDMGIADAQKQTYYGFVGAFFTPSRLGEYPSRILLMQHRTPWLSAVALGFVGSLLLILVIAVFGLPALVELFIGQDILRESATLGEWHYTWAIAAFFFLLILAGCLPQLSRWLDHRFRFRKQQTQQMFHALGELNSRQLWMATLWSVLRYLTFCVQLLLVLIACDANYSLGISPLLLTIPAYYLLVTITPTVPAADVAIKGSWAIVIFSAIGGNVASIAMATGVIWMINTIFPMLVGTLVKRNE